MSSYRGYYSDLAFEPDGEEITVGEFLKVCENALDTTYEGYKGGDFLMGSNTPLWISSYGEVSSIAIMDIGVTGEKLILVVKQID